MTADLTLDSLLHRIRQDNPAFDDGSLRRAYAFCRRVYRRDAADSADAHLYHLLEILEILVHLKVDESTLVLGLLHDIPVVSAAAMSELKTEFGADLFQLVTVGHRVRQIPYRKSNQQQVENFRKMFMTMARDLRVVLVSLADRVCTMRSLDHEPPERQRYFSRETLEIYAPLANRLGISALKGELEDLALRFLEPERYEELVSQISRQKEERDTYVAGVKAQIRQLLEKNAVEGVVSGRSKHLYSVYKKMERTGVDLEEIYDLTAFRILVTSIADCYAVLGLIHATWKPIPGRFKDYIAMPKSNMYQSLHTTVIGPFGERIEVQIRTHAMHRVAEEGVAAHWKYKESGVAEASGADDQRFRWLRQLMDWQQDFSLSQEVSSSGLVDLFPEEVYVFTPGGDVKEMPKGATPVDFAYAIHTDLGSQCVGARINGKHRPLRTPLQNGDIVEIQVQANHHPSKDWLSFVKTSKARNRIRQHVKAEQREKSLEFGRELLEKELRKYQYSLKRAQALESFKAGIEELGFKEFDDVLAAVGYGKLTAGQLMGHILPKEELRAATPPAKKSALSRVLGKIGGRKHSSSAVRIAGIDDVMVRFAQCCNPLPGEEVVGFITRGHGLSIHTADCSQVQTSEAERLIEVEWDLDKTSNRSVKIRVFCNNQKGMLVSLSGAITAADANILSASVNTTPQQQGVSQFEIDVLNLEHLNRVIREIKKVRGVYRVERLRS
ncbi:MAG: bifunctional (p)ppGpp synthetase/guanosine-3',5'-bis(diphosphate) 3'-pyrophosphohydrolase [Deltaproteobacteria bacterium]|nr:bifunctional (p)ppGpp synthetase/guanosine-3',5'-bis(diphosphate) 3'-pyrophosphohydrolase [Deltaproteobacteria bacterium]